MTWTLVAWDLEAKKYDMRGRGRLSEEKARAAMHALPEGLQAQVCPNFAEVLDTVGILQQNGYHLSKLITEVL